MNGKLDRWWDRILADEPRLQHATDEQVAAVFERRAISTEVWHARPYVPYDAGDWETVVAADPILAHRSAGVRAYMRKLVNQRPGLVMHRAGWAGRAQMGAQLRPFKFAELGFDVAAAYGAKDKGVVSAIEAHNHASPARHYHEGENVRAVNQARKPKRREPPAEGFMAAHIAGPHGGAAPADGVAHPHRPTWREHIARDHGGENVVGRHEYVDPAKYVYPLRLSKNEAARWKLVPEEDRPEGSAKRIDVHPLAWPLLEAGGAVCYFALEGLLKNDAILSTGAPVVNAGAVTLWDDAALGWRAENYLRRFGTIVVVPDSDGSGNALVSGNAAALAARLDGYGVRDVVVASPTAVCGAVCEHLTRDTGSAMLPNEAHKRGVDDFLGDGEALGSMIVEKLRPAPALPVLVGDKRARGRDATILRHLQQIVTPAGRVVVTHRDLGDVTRLGRSAAARALHSLADQGHVGLSAAPMFDDRPSEPPTRVDMARELVPSRDRMTLGDYLAG